MNADQPPERSADADGHDSRVVSVSTLAKFLCGRRTAIFAIGRSRYAIWLGLLFVISAGLAREYDGEDLLHEPWHLLLPLAASVASSLVLFTLLRGVAWLRGDRQSAFWSTYGPFLGLYWMTAPMAWLYAIPVERYLDPAGAVSVNLWLLGLVSVWRVLLISRVVSVIFRCRFVAALFVVMLFADALVFAALRFTPLPVFSIMGGIRLTESEQVIQGTAFLVGALATLTLPIWLIGTICVAWPSADHTSWKNALAEAPRDGRVTRSAWLLAVGSIAVWMAVLPLTQREQRNRWRVETALRDGRIDETLRDMSQHSRADFPPHWDPPPRIGYGETTPSMEELLDAVLRQPSLAEWVQEVFIEKVTEQALHGSFPMRKAIMLHRMDDDQLARYAEFVEQHPEGARLGRSHQSEINTALSGNETDWSVNFEPLPELTPRRRDSLERLQRLADREDDGA